MKINNKKLTVSVKQIQLLDKMAIESCGIPSIVLMESAGREVAGAVLKMLRNKRNVLIVCGTGNNGGDGLVAVRHLLNHGCRVKTIMIGNRKNLSRDAAVNFHILKSLRIPVQETRRMTEEIISSIKNADVAVDAIFGVGLNRVVDEPFKGFIEALNQYAKKIIAVDIPSGLDGTTGKILGACIKADKTVTFSLMKKGFLKNDGPQCSGDVKVVDIGIPKGIVSKIR